MSAAYLEFLGTGTSQGVPVVACNCRVCTSGDPKDKRLRTAALIRVGDRKLLIDAGPDLRQQMLRARVDRLDGVLITHEHMDHLAGMDDLRAFNFAQKRAMDIYSNEGTLEAVRRLFHYAFTEERYPGVPELRLRTVGEDVFLVADVLVRPINVMHGRLPILGYRIGGLAYITDAKTLSEEEVQRLQGVDTLVLNALRIQEHPTHLNLTEAVDLVHRIAPKRAYFTHISHLLGLHQEVSSELPKDVHLAHDGLRLEFPV